MSTFFGVQCDSCSKTLRFPRFGPPHETEMAPEWFTVYQGNIEGQNPSHFCSKQCMRQWMIGSAVQVKEQER